MPYLVTPELIDFTSQFEGLTLTARQDGGGKWLIGFGSSYLPGGAPVCENDAVTLEQAKLMLGNELQGAMHVVNLFVEHPITQNQSYALCDFAFNEGGAEFHRSTVLQRVNAGDLTGAADAFGLYIHDNEGKVEPGRVRRATARRNLFQTRPARVIAVADPRAPMRGEDRSRVPHRPR